MSTTIERISNVAARFPDEAAALQRHLSSLALAGQDYIPRKRFCLPFIASLQSPDIAMKLYATRNPRETVLAPEIILKLQYRANRINGEFLMSMKSSLISLYLFICLLTRIPLIF